MLRQLCNLIPNFLVPGLARQYDAEAKSRTFKPWSHLVTLIYAQLTHALGLNDVCDALRLNARPLSAMRGATRPSKNALSHANWERDAGMAEALFWKMLEDPKGMETEITLPWLSSKKLCRGAAKSVASLQAAFGPSKLPPVTPRSYGRLSR